uniref:WAP domain-containing protein n=1 Tax=Panagrellus redivivus TaxID=6233 RepID=A0A7E4VMB5_PANRE
MEAFLETATLKLNQKPKRRRTLTSKKGKQENPFTDSSCCLSLIPPESRGCVPTSSYCRIRMSISIAMIRTSIIALLFALPIAATRLSLCEYYNALGIYKPECAPVPTVAPTFDEDSEETASNLVFERPNPNLGRIFSISNSLISKLSLLNSFELTEATTTNPLLFSMEVDDPILSTPPPRSIETFNGNMNSDSREFPDIGLCQGYFQGCFPDRDCESGIACAQMRTNRKCCTAPDTRCPTPTELGYTCRKFNPTNWCNADSDCNTGRTVRQMCCPTGCSYNICLIDKTAPVMADNVIGRIYRTSKYMSEECPDPYSIDLRCDKPNPTHWCYSQSECPSHNKMAPRRCCMTKCGYNTCLVKYNGHWVIG